MTDLTFAVLFSVLVGIYAIYWHEGRREALSSTKPKAPVRRA